MLKKVFWWLILIFIVSTFSAIGGYYYAEEEYFNENERVDLRPVFKVWDVLEDEFYDVRTDEEKKDDNPNDRIWGMTSGLVDSFKDPYTIFLPPEISKEFQEDISGEFGGVGIEIENRDGFLTVVSPIPGTPASKAGMKSRDIIFKIDGKDSVSMSAFEAARLIRGEPGTEVVLTVLRKGEREPLDIKIIRDIIEIPTIKTYKYGDIFIIKIFSFDLKSPKEFYDVFKEFKRSGKSKLLIDLRNNPGGALYSAVYLAGMFLPEGELVVKEVGKDFEREELSGDYHINDLNINIFDNYVVGILVNEGSASASEILAGSLRDHKKAVLMGEKTYGKGTVQKIKEFKDGSLLKYTIAKFVLPSGRWINNDGIEVDIKIGDFDWERKGGTFSDEIDPQMIKAAEELEKIEDYEELVEILNDFDKKKEENKDKEKEEIIKNILND